MAAVHCTTIPCEPRTARKVQESHIFAMVCLFANNVRTFQYVLINVVEGFVCYELWVNAPVTISFSVSKLCVNMVANSALRLVSRQGSYPFSETYGTCI